MAALGYPYAKISLKEDVVPTLFPVVEAMLMSQASTTMVHLGLKRAVSVDTGELAHGEFGLVNSDSILWRLRPMYSCIPMYSC